MVMASKLFQDLRPAARDLPESGIVELVNAGRMKEGLVPLWVGEGHLPTPAFICEAAARSMAAGETFYTWQRGIPELRQALADYHTRLFARPLDAERFFATGSGMQAIQIALQALVGFGHEVIIPTPAWPNFAAAASIAGARVVEIAMHPPGFDSNISWKLDLDQLEAAVTAKSRVIFINSPSNPTGWTATRDELADILSIARRHDLWIIADEVYQRFYFGDAPVNGRAASFYDVADEDDKVIFTNTFSKNWAMTGWRVGWLSAPAALGQVIENLIQFSTSGVPVFVQRAATQALINGEDFVKQQVAAAAATRITLCDALSQAGGTTFAIPDGAFYLFFAMNGKTGSKQIAHRLIHEALLGLAPGIAFGNHNDNYFRLCFARSAQDINLASDRLTCWLKDNC